MNAVLYDVALTAYIAATATAIASLTSRREILVRLTRWLAQGGWIAHSVALVLRGAELGRVPLATLPEAISVVIWAVVLLELWAERRFRIPVLAAFVLPVVLMLGLALPTELRALVLAPGVRNAWIWAHVVLALVGLTALVLNFAGAVMYLLQERQIKGKQPSSLYYRLPSLEALDRLSVRTLTLGFAFLTAGLLMGAVRVGTAWGGALAGDPLAMLSLVAWVLYAATLSGRMTGRWRARRAAYFAVAGFCVLLVTLGAGMMLQGHHGS
ncbi:MAG TPA: cytochrome c biogenesis protein CcsA [Candidatus Binatia bacterium]|nr:cytochrome c biogenesis protein CcsA [Candidatus Binatia bacterium]